MKTLILFGALFSSLYLSGQNELGKLDDAGRIALASVVANDDSSLDPASRSLLAQKLDQLASRYGMGSSALNDRFILTANVQVLTKDITPTAPPMHAYTLAVGFFIGDGIDGTLFTATSKTLKGMGETPAKAYRAALKNIDANDPMFKSFLEEGKNKIITYYNTRCDFLIKESEMLAAREEFDAAIYKLTGVPDVCKACYDKAMDAVAVIYQKQIDHACIRFLADARNAWNESLDSYAAQQASQFLRNINPNANCFPAAQQLTSDIAKRIKELDQREWDFKLKEQQDAVNLRKASIQSAKEIGVAYGNNQPKNAYYNFKGWW
jgi:hypothetical protein